MRHGNFLGSILAAGAACAAISIGGAGIVSSPVTIGNDPASKPKSPKKRGETRVDHRPSWQRGKVYPHCSTRQRARYARQIAAGQLSMKGIDR